MQIQTEYMFDSTSFSPAPSELDENNDDYINPGIFALELADFLVTKLEAEGVSIKFRCQEDWGHWMEVEHDGRFTLALGCSNLDGSTSHRFFVEPRKAIIRRFFKKIDVRRQVEELRDKVIRVLETSGKAQNFRVVE